MVRRRRRTDVRHGAAHRQRGGRLIGEDGGDCRVVEVAGRAEAALACHVGVLGEALELRRRQVLRAEELQVLVLPNVVDQARVERSHRVYVAGPVLERRGRVAGRRVLEHAVGVVVDVGGGHQRRLDLRWAPVRVACLEQRGHAGDVRARHGRPRQDVEPDAAAVTGQARRAGVAAPCGQDVHAGRDEVRLEDLQSQVVWAPGGERGDHRRRPDPELGSGEAECRRRLWGGPGVLLCRHAFGLPNGHGWQEVAVGDELLAVCCGVGEDHADASRFLDNLALLHPRTDAAVAYHDLSGDGVGLQCPLEAHGPGVRDARVAAHVDHRILLPRRKVLPALVKRDAGDVGAVAERHRRREVTVHGARAHRGDPRRQVRQAYRVRAGVAGGAGDEHAHLHGPKRRD
ncbi:hypothetical protein VPH35_022724 [Triticum aestivum]